MRGTGRHLRRTRLRAIATGVAAVAVAAALSACGSSSSSDTEEVSGTYHVKVTEASFPTAQRLGQTALLRLGIRNSGKRTIPALNVTISVGGKQGRDSSLPFGYRDPQPGLAIPERPVWVLAAKYPRLAGSGRDAGATTSNPKTFDFGPLKPGAEITPLWKLSAVKSGRFTVLYRIGAGLNGSAKTVAGQSSAAAGGSFVANVSRVPPNTEVTDSGEVVALHAHRSGRR